VEETSIGCRVTKLSLPSKANVCRAPDLGVYIRWTDPFTETDEQGLRLRIRQANPLLPQLHTICCSFFLAPLCKHSSQWVGAIGVLDEKSDTHLPIISEPNQRGRRPSLTRPPDATLRILPVQGQGQLELSTKGTYEQSVSCQACSEGASILYMLVPSDHLPCEA
jgi:hypothetical protein